MLIGTILSQRTKDANTERASAALFARYPDARSLARAPIAELERLIHRTGYFHVKARAIRASAQAILDRFGGTTPADRDQLLSLPGVGPKTANCVLVFGFGLPAVPVDTHVHRIANRLGVVRTRTPEQTEEALMRVVPRDLWLPLNPILVQHGQNLCRPRAPLCPRCPVATICATGRALAHGRTPPRPEDRRSAPRPRRASRTVKARRP